MISYQLDNAVFTYLLSPVIDDRFSQHKSVLNGKYQLNYSNRTDVFNFINGENEIVIIGLCVDSHGEIQRDNIPSWFLSQNYNSKEDIFHASSCFAGKYIIFYRTGDKVLFFGDASCSLQLNYSFIGDTVYASSVDYLLGTHCGYNISNYSMEIRNSANYSHPMPYNLTMFDNIKALLPDHYLDITLKSAVRVKIKVPSGTGSKELVSLSKTYIENITAEYQKYYPLICPLTGGNDSKLVFAFMKNSGKSFNCYTFYHKGFTPQTPDVAIPPQICSDYSIRHFFVNDIEMSNEYKESLEAFIGPYHSQSTINMAATYLSSFSDYALVSGDIIDQIGKSLLGNNIPVFFASPSYFCCKLHNTSALCKRELASYLESIRNSGQWNYVFDLFGLESRCGRWAAQTGMIYSMCSINVLNIFNCRDVITAWISIPRKLRIRKFIHKSILEQLDPNLLSYPTNSPTTPIKSCMNIIGKTWIGFLLMTYCKQFIMKIRA